MKKNIYFAMAIAAMLFTACSQDDELTTVEKNQEYTIIAEMPQPITTRTIATDVSDDSGYAMSFAWKDEDQVRFHFIKSGDAWQSGTRNSTITDGKATFTLGSNPAASSYIYGCTNVNLNTSKTSDASTASTANFYLNCQNYIFASMEDIAKYNPMFGVIPVQSSATSIPETMHFKNVCSLIKFTVKGVETVTDVKIRGYKNNAARGLKIKQNLQITGSTGAAEFLSENYDNSNTNKDGSYEVTGKSYSKNDKNEIVFYAIVIPQELDGLYLQLNNSADLTKSVAYGSNKITLEPGKMYGVKLDFTNQ